MNADIASASKCYSAGDPILKCYPLVHTVKYEFRGICCDYCLKLNDRLKKCGKCGKLFYCGSECQRKDWTAYHKLECPVISKYKLLSFEKQGFDYMQRLVLRLYLMSVHKPDLLNRKYQLHNGLQRSLQDMESHSVDITNTKAFEGILNYFKLYSIEDYDKELVLRLYGILQINAFGIDVYDSERGVCHCASGLYIEASVFDHCCQSNACASGEGLMLEVRALTDIDVGQHITIDYVQNVLPKSQRQTSLKNKYYFICRCFRCESDFDQNFDYQTFSRLDTEYENAIEGQKRLDNCKNRKQFLRQFYPHFHPNYTYFLYQYLKCFLMVYKNKLKDKSIKSSEIITEYKNLCEDLFDNMKVTHGLDHTFYKMYINLIK